MNGIVMNVIYRSPEMTFRPHLAIMRAMPNLSAHARIFDIPFIRRASMKFAQLAHERFELWQQKEHVIMIWHYAPGVNILSKRTTKFKQLGFELRDAKKRSFKYVLMLITRGAD